MTEHTLMCVHVICAEGTFGTDHLELSSSTLISRRQFRDGLKSHLFADAYFWSSENIRYKSVMYLLTYLLEWSCGSVETFYIQVFI